MSATDATHLIHQDRPPEELPVTTTTRGPEDDVQEVPADVVGGNENYGVGSYGQ